MKLNDQEYALVPVIDLRLHPKNPNEGDEEAIAESVVENGFYGAVVAQRSTGYVLAGNHRLKVAQEMGAKTLPVIWLDVDDRQALKILTADNRIAELARRNPEQLAEVLSELNLDGGIAGTGYSDDDLDELVQSLVAPAEEEWAGALGNLTGDEREPFQQMVFTLHDEQAELVKRAMDAAFEQGPFGDALNTNKNGNALARICEAYLEGVGGER